MNKKTNCPVCASNLITDLYTIEVPVLQNKVFDKLEDAVNSPQGSVCLSSCENCSFVFNSTFDSDILVYDTSYDNSVPSKLFIQYYHDIAEYLYQNYDLKNGVLYDVGCGKGTFLKILCEKYPDVTALGIDPSYEGDLHYSKNLTFIQDFFESKYAIEKPSLVISRHVFEHIEQPTEFLRIIASALSKHSNIPFFIEVPDFTWIIENEAFWDICYEHCNYFNPKALENLTQLANTNLTKITPSFNNQYLWCEGIINSPNTAIKTSKNHSFNLENLLKFTSNIQELKDGSKSILKNYIDKGYKTVVWGMATKGVEYCNIVDPAGTLADYCIDININKQNKFIPFTGHKIQSANCLTNIQQNLLVIIMNTNYISEIKGFINQHNLKALFINGHGEVV